MNNLEIIGNNYIGKYDYIREASRAIILKDAKILLSYETKNDIWMLPGGEKKQVKHIETVLLEKSVKKLAIYSCLLNVFQKLMNITKM